MDNQFPKGRLSMRVRTDAHSEDLPTMEPGQRERENTAALFVGIAVASFVAVVIGLLILVATK